MSVLEIPAKEASPYVRFDEENGTLQIKGKSYDDDDVVMLFTMISSKVKAFGAQNPEKLDVNIYLKYFNTSSSKCLFDLLLDLKNLQENGVKVKIVWNFASGDDDMGEDIEDFSDSLDMEFDIQPMTDE